MIYVNTVLAVEEEHMAMRNRPMRQFLHAAALAIALWALAPPALGDERIVQAPVPAAGAPVPGTAIEHRLLGCANLPQSAHLPCCSPPAAGGPSHATSRLHDDGEQPALCLRQAVLAAHEPLARSPRPPVPDPGTSVARFILFGNFRS
ncbi:MAG TPA: hypothetical protein VNK67_00730 [Burkholderiales bacterium]|nr:hypothetical protein [Burkholderiales bacterium]